MSELPTCRSCKTPIVWGITAKAGARIPLDVGTWDDGNMVRVGITDRDVPIVVVLTRDQLDPARERGHVALIRSHHASCPDGDKWRRPKPPKGAP